MNQAVFCSPSLKCAKRVAVLVISVLVVFMFALRINDN